MVVKYRLLASREQLTQLDDNLYQYGVDEYIWWEDHDQVVVTDREDVLSDLEKIIKDMGLSYTKIEE